MPTGPHHTRWDNPTRHIALPVIERPITTYRTLADFREALAERDRMPIEVIRTPAQARLDYEGRFPSGRRVTPQALVGLAAQLMPDARQFTRTLLGLTRWDHVTDPPGEAALAMVIGTYNRLLDLFGRNLVGMRLQILGDTVERYLPERNAHSAAWLFDIVQRHATGYQFVEGSTSGSQYSVYLMRPHQHGVEPRTFRTGLVLGDVFINVTGPAIFRAFQVGRRLVYDRSALLYSEVREFRYKVDERVRRALSAEHWSPARQFMAGLEATASRAGTRRTWTRNSLVQLGRQLSVRTRLHDRWCRSVALRHLLGDNTIKLIGGPSPEQAVERLQQSLALRPLELAFEFADAAYDEQLTVLGRCAFQAAGFRMMSISRSS